MWPAPTSPPDASPASHDLVTGPGSFATAYLTTEAAVENAAQQSEVRWRTLRDELVTAGAPEEVVATVDPVVADAHLRGDGLGVVVRADGAVHVEHAVAPPRAGRALWSPLASVGQVLAWRQSRVAHLIVLRWTTS